MDTHDSPSVQSSASSMSYSLSQLDAIGDVDPVAEADVYLAYGRDLQAEEILKEAMRATPDRLAIRVKLLEVYAKRRDTKGYELQAGQLFALAGADSDEWHKAQELGRQIDPDNALYAPGGQPDLIVREGGRMVEHLDATTMPQSVMPKPPQPLITEPGKLDLDSGIDLDLDLGARPTPEPRPSTLEATQPFHRRGDRRRRHARAGPAAGRAPGAVAADGCGCSAEAGAGAGVARFRPGRPVARHHDRAGCGEARGRRRLRRCCRRWIWTVPTPTRWRASSSWPRSSARSATWKARATCSRK